MPMQTDDENKFAQVPLMKVNGLNGQLSCLTKQQQRQPNSGLGKCEKLMPQK
ncbi:MAG: hypothetical protein ABI621_02595 [Chloroflexota bacterium]